MKRFLTLLLLLSQGLPLLWSQEGSTIEDLVTLQINTRVLGGSNQVSWQETVDRHTILGKPVNLIIDGVNFQLKVIFTPYRAQKNTFLLVAQSQIRGQNGNRTAMATTVQTLEIQFKEPVVFFPMGVKDPEKEDHQLMLQLVLLPYDPEKKIP